MNSHHVSRALIAERQRGLISAAERAAAAKAARGERPARPGPGRWKRTRWWDRWMQPRPVVPASAGRQSSGIYKSSSASGPVLTDYPVARVQ